MREESTGCSGRCPNKGSKVDNLAPTGSCTSYWDGQGDCASRLTLGVTGGIIYPIGVKNLQYLPSVPAPPNNDFKPKVLAI